MSSAFDSCQKLSPFHLRLSNTMKRARQSPKNWNFRTESGEEQENREKDRRFKSLSIRVKSESSNEHYSCEAFTNAGVIPHAAPSIGKMTILSPEFFLVDALDLAPRLLGKFLRRDDVVLKITEVEAYRPHDSACHGRFGITARTAPIAGRAYVYLCYGLHMMLNVVADKEGVGAAVLIRSCAPVTGLETIQQRRGQKTKKPILLTGPGKIGQALGLSTEWSNHPLYTPGGLELLDGPEPENILIGPRVGINYALPEHVNALWRFAIAGTPWVSAPTNTLVCRADCKIEQ